MWKLFMRLMAPEGDGSGGGAGGAAGDGGKPGGNGGDAGAGQGQGDKGILASGGSAGAGAGDVKGAAAGADKGTQGDPSKPWSWAEGVPGAGAIPAWFKADKFKTIGEQAAAAVELEKKLGPAAEFFGAPEGGKYATPKVEGWEWDADDPTLKGFQEFAAKRGFSQKGFEEVLNWYAGVQAEQGEKEEAALADALQKLGPNGEQRVKGVEKFLVAKIGQEAYDVLDGAIGTNVAAFEAISKIVALAANDASLAPTGGTAGGVGFSRKDIEAEQFKKFPEGHALAGKSMYEHDQNHRKKVDDMWAKLFPGEDVQNVG